MNLFNLSVVKWVNKLDRMQSNNNSFSKLENGSDK